MENFRIEMRYAVLISLLMLLWLSLEYMIGIQDKFIQWQPYVNLLSFVVLPSICIRLALRDKLDQDDKKSAFKDIFLVGFLVSFFAAVLSIIVQLVFFKLINPDFFDAMIEYQTGMGKLHHEEAHLYFNLAATIIRAGFLTLLLGTIASAIWAARLRNDN